ncbi:MAG TPA: tetratricopeptide repeat protein [Methylocella sp.]|nr:tetratricopeptide repeat protein [Methylocella sp.]
MPMTWKLAKNDRWPHRYRSAWGLAACLLLALVFPAASAQARVRENLAIATPFEVGESPAGNYLAASIAVVEHDTVAAATFFREALRYDPRNPSLLERAFVAAVSNGNMQDAFGLADRLLERDPKNSLARLVLGVKAIKAKRFTAARAQFKVGGSGQQHDITTTLLTAWTYAGAHDKRRALSLVDKLRGDNFAVFKDYHAALIADAANDPQEASKRMKAAYASDKNTLRLVDAYARFAARHNDRAEAVRAYQAFDQLLPNHPIVSAMLADINSGKPIEPLVKNAEEGAAEVLYGLGAAGGQQGDELAAMIYLRLALYLTPQNGLAIISLGDLYERIKQNEQAIDVYGLVQSTDPLRTTADIQTGQILEAMGRPDEATKYLKRVVDENPSSEDALSALGNLQRAHKQYGEAIETYSRVLAKTTTPQKANWPIYYFRGISYEREKKWPQAQADLMQALALFPDQPLVLNYLGYSWVDQGMNLDEAFTMLQRAVELRPTDGYIVDSLGWANYRLGRIDESVKQLERAIDLKPSDPVINDHLGDAYWRAGRQLEAHFQWNHARDLGPEPEDKDKILRKIEHGLEDEPKPAAADAEPKKSGG